MTLSIINSKKNRILLYCIVMSLFFNCNKKDKRSFFMEMKDSNIYQELNDKTKSLMINFKLNKKNINKEINSYNLNSFFLNGLIYNDDNKIFFINPYKKKDYILFDFKAKIGTYNIAYLFNNEAYTKIKLDSIIYDVIIQDSVFVYNLSRLEKTNDLPYTSPSGVKYIYVNQRWGIRKVMISNSNGLLIYVLEK